MLKVVLPTADIVREFKNYEPIFCFYKEDGLKGIVRDVVLISNGMIDVGDDHMSEEAPLLEAFIEQVTACYENSMEQRYLENTYVPQPSLVMELVIAQISRNVNEMMRAFFMLHAYEICKSRWSWLGSDLVVNLELLDNPYVAA